MTQKSKLVLLGVTGSIAAYKAADLASRLTQAGVAVQVVMTDEAQRFIAPLTFTALTQRPVVTSLWDEEKNLVPTHIELADSADLVLIAPATAHLIAQMAHGLAGDALTSLLLAVPETTPCFVAPAMNGKMWKHSATQENVRTLEKRGVNLIAPHKGKLACGYDGEGRLAPVEEIAETVLKRLK